MAVRTTAASTSTVTASARPSIRIIRNSPSANAPNTTTITAAALVITGAVRASPLAMASASPRPERRASATRATRNTS